jgi:hypothetical protein
MTADSSKLGKLAPTESILGLLRKLVMKLNEAAEKISLLLRARRGTDESNRVAK